jgi:hypothetical protein
MIRGHAVLPTLFVTSVTINKSEHRSDGLIDPSLNSIDFGVACTGQSTDALLKRNLPLSFQCEFMSGVRVFRPKHPLRPPARGRGRGAEHCAEP